VKEVGEKSKAVKQTEMTVKKEGTCVKTKRLLGLSLLCVIVDQSVTAVATKIYSRVRVVWRTREKSAFSKKRTK
jgi:hypothetical protein